MKMYNIQQFFFKVISYYYLLNDNERNNKIFTLLCLLFSFMIKQGYEVMRE